MFETYHLTGHEIRREKHQVIPEFCGPFCCNTSLRTVVSDIDSLSFTDQGGPYLCFSSMITHSFRTLVGDLIYSRYCSKYQGKHSDPHRQRIPPEDYIRLGNTYKKQTNTPCQVVIVRKKRKEKRNRKGQNRGRKSKLRY